MKSDASHIEKGKDCLVNSQVTQSARKKIAGIKNSFIYKLNA
jgi:hypothetical protein